MAPSVQKVLYAEFTARPGADREIAAMLADYAEKVRAEEGNIVFDSYRIADKPQKFFVYEIYRDEAAFQAHLAAPYGPEFNKRLTPLIVEPSSQLTFLAPL